MTTLILSTDHATCGTRSRWSSCCAAIRTGSCRGNCAAPSFAR